MVLLLNGPIWFRGFESLFVFVAGLVTILIALMSYKAYKLTNDSKYKYFSVSFFLMSVSFFFLSLFSTLLITHVSDTLTNMLGNFDIAFLVHLLLALVAYMLLLIVTLKIKNLKVITLLMALILLFVGFSYQHYLKFHLISFMLLFFLSYQFYTNYLKKKQINAKLVFASFYLLTVAEAFLILYIYSHDIFYVVGRLAQFTGYIVLFGTFLRIANHGRKKRKA